jgi:TonB family protein
LDDADQELLRAFFSRHHSFVCLLLQPLSRDTCTADVQFWRADESVEEAPGSLRGPFLLQGSQLVEETAEPEGTAPSVEVAEIAETKESGATEVGSEPRRPALVLPLPASRRIADESPGAVPGAAGRVRILMPSLLLLLAVLGAGAIYQFWTGAHNGGGDTPSLAQVRFDARPSAGALQLSWDTTLSTVARATRGVLAVTEGGNANKEIPLSQDQLRLGRFTYTGPSGSTLFHLRVYDKDRLVGAESLRVVQPDTPRPAVPDAPTAPVDRLPSKVATGLATRPPEVRQEVQPVISPGIRARISSPTVVQVVVKVDESGRVAQASTRIAGHGIQRYLADQAVKAARQWSFRPARSKDGSPVAATKTISFEFTPTAH